VPQPIVSGDRSIRHWIGYLSSRDIGSALKTKARSASGNFVPLAGNHLHRQNPLPQKEREDYLWKMVQPQPIAALTPASIADNAARRVQNICLSWRAASRAACRRSCHDSHSCAKPIVICAAPIAIEPASDWASLARTFWPPVISSSSN
jgi:hypothetical protein